MVNKIQTGMQGVFLVAAELTGRGFIVSVTSRNAFGADLLVTDQQCRKAWSVQVKTNRKRAAGFWLLSKHSEKIKSPSHIYTFVNLNGAERPDYYVVKSPFVAKNVKTKKRKNSTWYQFLRNDAIAYLDGWNKVFGIPSPQPERQLEPS